MISGCGRFDAFDMAEDTFNTPETPTGENCDTQVLSFIRLDFSCRCMDSFFGGCMGYLAPAKGKGGRGGDQKARKHYEFSLVAPSV